MSKGSALIVGVGPGLGLALAEAFARDGHPVALFGRDAARLDKYASGLTAEGRTAGAYSVDAAHPEGLVAALTRAADEFGTPEVLVYNAALMGPDTPADADAREPARKRVICHDSESSELIGLLNTRHVLNVIVDDPSPSGLGLQPACSRLARSRGDAKRAQDRKDPWSGGHGSRSRRNEHSGAGRNGPARARPPVSDCRHSPVGTVGGRLEP